MKGISKKSMKNIATWIGAIIDIYFFYSTLKNFNILGGLIKLAKAKYMKLRDWIIALGKKISPKKFPYHPALVYDLKTQIWMKEAIGTIEAARRLE